MTRFLEPIFDQLVQDGQQPTKYIVAIRDSLRAGNSMLRFLYGHGLFVRKPDAVEYVRIGYDFLSSYLTAADEAFKLKKCRFRLTPKYHAVNHLVDYVLDPLKDNPEAEWFLNPVAWSTQQDEDFTGRVSLLSTAVSSRSCHVQTMARYAINLWNHMSDFEG